MNLLEVIRTIEQFRGRPQTAYTSWAIGKSGDPDLSKKLLENLDRKFLCLAADLPPELAAPPPPAQAVKQGDLFEYGT